ncbi:glycoprotein 3-alpha-L-fucosyltransferase A-like [Amblyomma americanum]
MALWPFLRRTRFVRQWRQLRRRMLIVFLASCATLVALRTRRSTLPTRRILSALGDEDRVDLMDARTHGPHRSVGKLISCGSEVADHRLPWFFKNGTEWPRPSSKLTRVANVWPEPEAPHDDRIVAQLMYLPPGYGGRRHEAKSALKTILLEGSWGGVPDGQSQFLRDRCPVDRCRVYRSYRDVNEDAVAVDAVVFGEGYSGPSLDLKGKQVWILHLLENPHHTGFIVDEGRGIDWTASYRMDSDIVTPYAKFVLYDPLVKTTRRHHDYAQNKSKLVAWFVSNCVTSNKRLEYAYRLQEHVQVDIYGACGPLSCPRSLNQECNRMLERDYLFYLAFENANCKDYITEKFFNALRHNVVPVVMGASREEYRAAAPHHSYIHVENFRSPKELAEYLLVLSRNRTLYNEYFRWKGTGEFVNTYFWCRLCALLHAPPRPHKRRSENVYRWWHTGACRAEDR